QMIERYANSLFLRHLTGLLACVPVAAASSRQPRRRSGVVLRPPASCSRPRHSSPRENPFSRRLRSRTAPYMATAASPSGGGFAARAKGVDPIGLGASRRVKRSQQQSRQCPSTRHPEVLRGVRS